MKKTRENKNKNTRLKDLNSQKAITLIALVVTIVVLLILAGVSLSLVLGENGLINKAKEGRDKYAESAKNEQLELGKVDEWLEENTGSLYKPMITKWNIEAGDTVEIRLYDPIYADNTAENTTNVTIDWGDETKKTYTSSDLQYDSLGGYVTHTYQKSNSETLIEILGECNRFYLLGDSKSMLISIEDWGYTGSQKYTFFRCENLTTIASPRSNTFKNVISFEDTFSECSSLTSIPSDLFANCSQVTNFGGTFFGCTNLTTIPADLFANCTQATNFGETFMFCTNLTSIPENLFANCTQVTNFDSTFFGGTNLTGEAIPLWERVEDGAENDYQGNPDGEGCYYGCTQLTNYDIIPEYWKKEIAPE